MQAMKKQSHMVYSVGQKQQLQQDQVQQEEEQKEKQSSSYFDQINNLVGIFDVPSIEDILSLEINQNDIREQEIDEIEEKKQILTKIQNALKQQLIKNKMH